MLKITKLYYTSFNKGLCTTFHQNVAKVLNDSELTQESDLKDAMNRYSLLIDEMKGLVVLHRGFETTPAINDANKVIENRFRYLYRMLRVFELDNQVVSKEEWLKLEREVLDVFPLSLLRLGNEERIAKLSAFVAHVQKDWMPLLEKTELKESFLLLAEQIQYLTRAFIERAEEKTGIEQGQATRVMRELYETYGLLCLYIEAWSNSDSDNPVIQLRQQRALDALVRINEQISFVKHSLAVAKSNRKRAKDK